jgi:hypothetical protein
MHLGQLLETLRREEDASLALEALGDVVLFTEIAAMAQIQDESPAEYVSVSASRFANQADHQDWLQLVSAIERSDDAGRTLLTKVVRWALLRDSQTAQGGDGHGKCSCGS